MSDMPRVPYGAVYFRKSNPPREDWERDYKTASEDGINIFRHWFLWSAIEVEPGVYDWEDYDRQLDLGHKYGIKTIIAEMITAVPEWLFFERPQARYTRSDGTPIGPGMGGSCVTGGFPGMSLSDEVVKQRAEMFLTALVERYRDHPGLGGYDLWNECAYYDENFGYCEPIIEAFRVWLKERYGSLKALANAWQRHSLSKWEYVTPPRQIMSYPDSFDWLEFLKDNAYSHLRWRVDLVRRLDPNHLVTAHGMAATIVSGAHRGADDWRAASKVDVYGVTWIAARQGDDPYQHIHAMDLVRCASRGKPFWHSESQAGPLWLQPQVVGRPLESGRVASPSDVKLWNLTSFAGGAAGILCPRWRPLLNGPLFGAFGSYGMDGSRTDRSRAASEIAKWSTQHADLFDARPVRGEIGIVFVPETQVQEYALNFSVERYTQAMRGAYQGFLANNIQADFVHIDDVDGYDLLYLPLPFMLHAKSAETISNWVKKGGKLVSESLPGYFGAHGLVGQVQPNFGLDATFGAKQKDVIFAPDISHDLKVSVHGHKIEGGGYTQTYLPEDGVAVGHFENGEVAAVENRFGKGKTLLIGTNPSLGFYHHRSEGARQFFKSLIEWGDAKQTVQVTNTALIARLHEGGGQSVLWILNPSRSDQSARLDVRDVDLGTAEVMWGDAGAISTSDQATTVTVPARDALVIRC